MRCKDLTAARSSNITTVATGLVAVMNEAQSQIIRDNPIGKGLDAFRALFCSTCESKRVSCSPDAVDQFDEEGNDNT